MEKEIKENKKKEKTKKEKTIMISVIVILAIIIIMGLIIIPNYVEKNKETKDPDQEEKLFTDEYPNVEKDNVFVYKNIDEIIKILENGTGVVYLGFPECPWCCEYVTYLNDVAKEQGLEKIYYYNILQDRKDNTEKYQKIVELIGEYLQYDEEGNKRVYVPAVIAVRKGKILGFDDETAWDTKGFKDPKDYWTEDEVTDLKVKLEKMINDVIPPVCTDCNK